MIFAPGIPAAGHLTATACWHAGSLDSCPKCETITTRAVPSRGANLMTNTTAAPAEPATELPDRNRCQHEFAVADFDGGPLNYPCGAPAEQWPTLDDAYSAHVRATGEEDEAVQPAELPLCQDHFDELVKVIEGQDPKDPYRIWIAAMPRTLVIGYTKAVRPAPGQGLGYVPFADGYRPGAPQHELVVTVPLHPDLQPFRIAELVFIATNAPELDPGSPEELIRLAIEDTGYKGVEAHWSLSVGDTVSIEGGPRLACQTAGWAEVKR